MREIIDRFIDESQNIYNFLDYIEITFQNDCRFCYDIMSEEKSEYINTVLKDYKIVCNNNEEYKNNQKILNEIHNLINEQIDICDELIKENKSVDIPTELCNSKIINENQCIVDSLGIVYTIFKCEEYDKYLLFLNEYTPERLKDEICYDEVSKSYYNYLTDEDWQAILKYSKLKYYNDYVDSLVQNYNYLIDKQTLYNTFSKSCTINIYRQVFILLLTLFDATLSDIKERFISEELKTKIIGKKAHGTLKTIYEDNPSIFIIDNKNEFSFIIENTERRNIHVHNSVVINKYYLEHVVENIYDFEDGQYANIDRDYFIKCYKNLNQLIKNLESYSY